MAYPATKCLGGGIGGNIMSNQYVLTAMSLPPIACTYCGCSVAARRINSARSSAFSHEHKPGESTTRWTRTHDFPRSWSSLLTSRNFDHSGSEPLYGGCWTTFVKKGKGKNRIGTSGSTAFLISSFSLSDKAFHSLSAHSRRGFKTRNLYISQHAVYASTAKATRLGKSAHILILTTSERAYLNTRPHFTRREAGGSLGKYTGSGGEGGRCFVH